MSARRARCCPSATTSSPTPDGLIAYIVKHPGGARVRPDMKVVFFDEWETPAARLKVAAGILRALVGLAAKGRGRRDKKICLSPFDMRIAMEFMRGSAMLRSAPMRRWSTFGAFAIQVAKNGSLFQYRADGSPSARSGCAAVPVQVRPPAPTGFVETLQ
jgi:hypothetical protein